MYGLPDTTEYGPDRAKRLPSWAMTAAVLTTIPILWLMVSAVDTRTLRLVWTEVSNKPGGLLVVMGAFAAAFGLRSFAWVRVLRDLSIGQSWAGLHVALGGNHVLPFRLGEPLRVASVVRRAGIDWRRATASTITLRAADLVAIALIGVGAGIGVFSAWWAVAGIVVLGLVFVVAGMFWLRRLSREREVRLPGPVALGATTLAWGLEAVVIYQVAGWAGADLGFEGACAVTASAVVAQIAGFAPGGIGTYEAGGV
ncbi:MAG TPA: lysylphosphatidylglycerol synthase domain-containing protein, partial [Acidimicrobiia bacterium]|nr:lysylphosphatidylglycerol synthase domain-containing protein [Acidimicrobiia bacterium]